MAKVPLNEKFDRVLRFLLSLNNRRVAAQLRARGFGPQERRTGWDIFEKAAGRHLNETTTEQESQSPARALVDKLDAWENVWFDVADATLRHAHPDVHERLFLNLSKTKGPQVVVTVSTLLKRLDELEQQAAARRDGDGDSELPAALALLSKRGLDEPCRVNARELLTAVEQDSVLEFPVPDPASETERLEAIEQMWRWYKDWAQIARTVVLGKRDRISMGLATMGRRKGSGSQPVVAPPLADTPVAPTLTPTPGAAPEPGNG